MRIKRYYHKKNIEPWRIRAIRDVLVTTIRWDIINAEFILYYPAEERTFFDIDELDSAVSSIDKDPTCISALFENGAQMFFELATCDSETITIELDTKKEDPYPILNHIEPILSLAQIEPKREVKSAFLAHDFNEEGSQYASEIARFLSLLGISSKSGREFSPDSVSEKIQGSLSKHDIFIVILTCKENTTWLIQETTAAKFLKKPLFILKQEDASFKLGLLGDHEFIPFPKGQICRTYIHILEGLQELSNGQFNT